MATAAAAVHREGRGLAQHGGAGPHTGPASLHDHARVAAVCLARAAPAARRNRAGRVTGAQDGRRVRVPVTTRDREMATAAWDKKTPATAAAKQGRRSFHGEFVGDEKESWGNGQTAMDSQNEGRASVEEI